MTGTQRRGWRCVGKLIGRVRGFGGGRDRFAQTLASDWATWTQVVRENNIRAE